jgi:TolB-like protein
MAALMLVGAAVWWTRSRSPPTPIIENALALRPLSAPRLSIVVLPFANLSADRDQQYFADGITDDLTTDLSRLTDMFVIARNTACQRRREDASAGRSKTASGWDAEGLHGRAFAGRQTG